MSGNINPIAAEAARKLALWLDIQSNVVELSEFHDAATNFAHAAALLRQIGMPLPAAAPLQPPAGGEAEGMTWQPIETAPRDGTEILITDYDVIDIVSWDRGDWLNRQNEDRYPVHWQPLPDHPELHP